jgi:type VI secretion system secreted protein VgrG
MGKIRVEAQGDELELLGLKTVTLQSNEDWVRITGKKGVIVQGGSSYIKFWPGGIELGTKEDWVVYAREHVFSDPRSLEVPTQPSFSSPDFCLECWLIATQGRSGLMPLDS